MIRQFSSSSFIAVCRVAYTTLSSICNRMFVVRLMLSSMESMIFVVFSLFTTKGKSGYSSRRQVNRRFERERDEEDECECFSFIFDARPFDVALCVEWSNWNFKQMQTNQIGDACHKFVLFRLRCRCRDSERAYLSLNTINIKCGSFHFDHYGFGKEKNCLAGRCTAHSTRCYQHHFSLTLLTLRSF